MGTIWIIGAGRFGCRAARELHGKKFAGRIVVIDKNPNKLDILKNIPVELVCMDGITFLVNSLIEPNALDWIVPAIPMHVAYEWVCKKLSEQYGFQTLPVSQRLIKTLPNPIQGKSGEVYFSNADFVCPEDCPAPPAVCTHTGKARPVELYRLLKAIPPDEYCSVVVNSRQLHPGVGGYSGQTLFNALKAAAVSDRRILLSTVCRCHGVMHAFRLF
jgi:hypothetical protein